jgi:hypothetical protein
MQKSALAEDGEKIGSGSKIVGHGIFLGSAAAAFRAYLALQLRLQDN